MKFSVNGALCILPGNPKVRENFPQCLQIIDKSFSFCVSDTGVTGSFSDLIRVALPSLVSSAGLINPGRTGVHLKSLRVSREEMNEDLGSVVLPCIYY